MDYYFLVERLNEISIYVGGFQSYFLRSLGDGFVEDGMAGSYNLQSQNRRERLEAEAMEEAVCRIKFSVRLLFGQCLFFFTPPKSGILSGDIGHSY